MRDRFHIEVGGRGVGKTTRLIQDMRRNEDSIMVVRSDEEADRLHGLYPEIARDRFVCYDEQALIGNKGGVLIDDLHAYLYWMFEGRFLAAAMTGTFTDSVVGGQVVRRVVS